MSHQQSRKFEAQITKKVRLNYLLYLPPEYEKKPNERWPLIMFLHGLGERGDDLSLIKKHGIPKILDTQNDFPFIAISPQCPVDSWWPLESDALRALLDHIIADYRVDVDRVYLTGLSMGGYGTWTLAIAHPALFAAIAPICGGGVSPQVGVLKDVPAWVFHGALDDIVPVAAAHRMVDALRAAGGNVRMTVYPDVGHDSWTMTYDNPELYQWLLEQRRQP
jgi:predicted peptidase